MTQATIASVPYCSPAYILDLALGAWGYCSFSTLVAEVEVQTGLDRDSARAAVERWAQNPRVKVDDGYYYIPGLGGC